MPDFQSIEAGILDWPMSVIRLRSANADELAKVAEKNYGRMAKIHG